MRTSPIILSVLLAGQVALSVGIAVHHTSAESRSPAKLLAFDPVTVDGLAIQEADQPPLALEKHDGTWVLPGVDDAPANNPQVVSLILTLNKLVGGWPVATTEDAAKRFKVADDDFTRRIAIKSGGRTLTTLLLGTSPTYGQTNVRVKTSDSIFTVPFGASDASGKPEDWEDKSLLTLSPADISKIELPGITLQRGKDGFQAVDLAAGEEMAADKTDTVERDLTMPLYDSILGTTAKPDYGLDKPVLSIGITLKDGRQLHYDVGKQAQGNDYVLRSSAQAFLFRLPKYAVTDLLNANRAALVRPKGQVDAVTKSRVAPPVTNGHG